MAKQRKRGLQLSFTEPGVKDGDSPNEDYADGQSTAVRMFDVDWTTRFLARAQLLGYPIIEGVQTNDGDVIATLFRWLPESHPERENLVVTAVSMKGLGGRAQQVVNGRRINAYAKARLTCKYTRPDYAILYDDDPKVEVTEFARFVSWRVEAAAEYLAPPVVGSFKWAEGPAGTIGVAYPGNPGIIVGTEDYHFTWRQIPWVPTLTGPLAHLPHETIKDTIGRVNQKSFAGFAAHTLLLMAYPMVLKSDPYEKLCWDIEYVMRFKKEGWNRFWDWQSKQWLQISSDGALYTPSDNSQIADGKLVYNERDFFKLFRVGY